MLMSTMAINKITGLKVTLSQMEQRQMTLGRKTFNRMILIWDSIQPNDNQPIDNQPNDNQPNGNQPNDNQPNDTLQNDFQQNDI